MLKIPILFLTCFSLTQGRSFNSVQKLLETWNFNKTNVAYNELPLPGDLIHQLAEDEFEIYMDFWMEKKYQSKVSDFIMSRADCIVPLRNALTEPQPVYELGNGLKIPSGTTGTLVFAAGETITLSCPDNGNYLKHPLVSTGIQKANVICQSGATFTSPDLSLTSTYLPDITCNKHVQSIERNTGVLCAAKKGIEINIIIPSTVNEHVIMTACFNQISAEALYVTYEQNPENAIIQGPVDPLLFSQGQWYPGISSVDILYEKKIHRKTLFNILGHNKYLNSKNFLSRGHLAARSDFVLSPSQRATYTFINVAPQWSMFNGANWGTLEQNLKERIALKNVRTKIYTGTWDILKLKDKYSIPQEIYLEPSTKKIPVPLWYYKVVYEPLTKKGTAFVGINNPFENFSVASQLALNFGINQCTSSLFSWLKWDNSIQAKGFCFCFDVNDFRKVVDHLPNELVVTGLLTLN